jgi:hypothetical protein
VWVPDDRPEPPGQTHPASWSGKGGDEAQAAGESIQRDRAARKDIDARLGEALSRTHSAEADSRQRLRDLHGEIRAGAAALQPTLDTVAGQQQMAEFLLAKTREVKAVVTESSPRQRRPRAPGARSWPRWGSATASSAAARAAPDLRVLRCRRRCSSAGAAGRRRR